MLLFRAGKTRRTFFLKNLIATFDAFVPLRLAGLLGLAAFLAFAVSAAPSCERLKDLKLPDTSIIAAQTVAAGAFLMPGLNEQPPALKDLPAFCRVTAEIKPSSDSDIKLEVWMPLSGWNGKYRGQGNGGFAGYIGYPGLVAAIRRGYATAATDTGHTGGETDATWALHHPEKITDFGYRAIHEMTLKAKAIIQAFYGEKPARSYFASCSNGGRQGLMEAQRFPEDYDGIIAGAPANFWTHLFTAIIWDLQAMQNDPASYIPASKIPTISAAVLAACDANDGVTDGILNDPRACRFDPAAILCKDSDFDSCLTAPQVAALRKIYAGPRNSKGEQIFPGLSPGGEIGPEGWSVWITGSAPSQSLQFDFGSQFFINMVFNIPSWDFKIFNFDTGVKLADDKQSANLNAIDPNLKAFKARGGKLILYHGWSDAAIPPLATIDYYNSVVSAMGPRDTSLSVRLYMVPGMQHCGEGPGASSFGQHGPSGAPPDPQRNLFIALEQWVEKGVAPERVIATKLKNERNPAEGVQMTRPLCPFPQVAKYKGAGDTNDEANFVCAPADEKKP